LKYNHIAKIDEEAPRRCFSSITPSKASDKTGRDKSQMLFFEPGERADSITFLCRLFNLKEKEEFLG
jgi:hypothetical protein